MTRVVPPESHKMPDFARDTRGKRHVPPRVLCSFLHKMQVALATCSMSKTVQKAPGADGLRRLWTWAKQCKKHLEQMAYAACGHGQTVQKAPGVDSKRRLWPCDRSGGARWLRPPPSHLPSLATPAWRAGARAPPGPGQVASGGFGPSKPPGPACPPSPHLEGWSTCATWASLREFHRACSFE